MHHPKVWPSDQGTGIQAVTSDLAAGLGLKQLRGGVVRSVQAGEAAATAGLLLVDRGGSTMFVAVPLG